MKITILGCGGSPGVPSLGGADGRGNWGRCDPAEPRNRRTRASIVIAAPDGNILVDTGPDMRAQLLANAVPRIDAVIYTHAHADHIMGLDDVRLLNRITGQPIPAYATQTTFDELQQRFGYAFKPWEPPGFYRPVLLPNIVQPGQTVRICGTPVQFFEQDHHVVRTLGLRLEGFAYSTDLVRLAPAALATLAGTACWLVGCFQPEPHLTHAHLAQVLNWRQQLGIQRTVLTHMGFDMDWATLAAQLPQGVEPAFDGMILES